MGIADKLKQNLHAAKEAMKTIVADPDVQESRIAICNGCEFFTRARTCSKCGCLMDAKTRLAGSSCPMKKW